MGGKRAEDRDGDQSRQRGRPTGVAASPIHDALLLAFRECLKERTHNEITVKEVAQRAGTSPEMVRYYFGSKDGLVTALLHQASERTTRLLETLVDEILTQEGNPTRRIFATLFTIYLNERHTARISISEFQKSKSVIHDAFLKDRAELIISHVHRCVVKLVEAGIYKPDLDTRKTAMSMMTMVSGPVTFLAVLSSDWVSDEELAGDGWLDHLSDLIDCKCKA